MSRLWITILITHRKVYKEINRVTFVNICSIRSIYNVYLHKVYYASTHIPSQDYHGLSNVLDQVDDGYYVKAIFYWVTYAAPRMKTNGFDVLVQYYMLLVTFSEFCEQKLVIGTQINNQHIHFS